MNSLTRLSLCISVALTGAATAPAAVLYDLSSTVLSGGAGSNTFVANTGQGAALSYNSVTPSLTETLTPAGQVSFNIITFAPVTLTNIGDSISVSYSFTPSSANAFQNADTAMRVGFFNSGGTQISSNLTSASDASFSGDVGYLGLYRTAGVSSTANTFYQRNGTGGTQVALWDSGARTSLSGPTLASPGTGAVTGTFTLTLVTGGGVQMTSVINGGTAQSLTDATSPFTTFDYFSFFGVAGATNPTVTFSNLTISSVPEPSTALLLGACGIGFAAFRRRRA